MKSKWDALDEARSADCMALPLTANDLRIETVHLIPEVGPTLLLEVTSRRGVRGFYHLPFRSLSDLKDTNLVSLPISQESQFLGAALLKDQAVFVIRARDKGKPVIQIRDLKSNAILGQMPFKETEIFELIAWQRHKGALQSTFRLFKDQEATDDQPLMQLEIPLDLQKNRKTRAESTKAVVGETEIFGNDNGDSYLIWLDKGSSMAAKQPRFRLAPWQADKKDTVYDLHEKGPIETWAFNRESGYLAYIRGDSLLWENASLEVALLSRMPPFQKQNQASLALNRVHVAQPLLASSGKEDYLFLPQWLDHEITLGVYKLSAGRIEPQGFSGVFKEGTAFYQAFYHEPSKTFYTLSRSSTTAQFSLCEVET